MFCVLCSTEPDLSMELSLDLINILKTYKYMQYI